MRTYSFLSHVVQPKPANVSSSSASGGESSREYSSRLSGAISNSIISIGDVFKDTLRDGPKSVKFPEKLLKVLEHRLEDIAMGKDAAYAFAFGMFCPHKEPR